MTGDINNWLANPAENFGWIILGDESKSSTAIRFSSRENSSEEQQPLLTLYFEGPVAVADRLKKESEWQVFQNGPQGQLSLRGNSAGKEMLFELYSLTGAKVYSETLPQGSAQFAVYTGLHQEGIYIYRLQSGNTVQSGKIRITSY